MGIPLLHRDYLEVRPDGRLNTFWATDHKWPGLDHRGGTGRVWTNNLGGRANKCPQIGDRTPLVQDDDDSRNKRGCRRETRTYGSVVGTTRRGVGLPRSRFRRAIVFGPSKAFSSHPFMTRFLASAPRSCGCLRCGSTNVWNLTGTRWRFKSKYGALHGIGDLSAAEHVLHSEEHFDRCKRLRRRRSGADDGTIFAAVWVEASEQHKIALLIDPQTGARRRSLLCGEVRNRRPDIREPRQLEQLD